MPRHPATLARQQNSITVKQFLLWAIRLGVSRFQMTIAVVIASPKGEAIPRTVKEIASSGKALLAMTAFSWGLDTLIRFAVFADSYTTPLSGQLSFLALTCALW